MIKPDMKKVPYMQTIDFKTERASRTTILSLTLLLDPQLLLLH